MFYSPWGLKQLKSLKAVNSNHTFHSSYVLSGMWPPQMHFSKYSIILNLLYPNLAIISCEFLKLYRHLFNLFLPVMVCGLCPPYRKRSPA